MRVFEPPVAFPSRGLLRIVGGSLLTLLRSLPSLIGLLALLTLVAGLTGLAVALPAAIGAAIAAPLGYLAGGLMLILALPFLVLWVSAGRAALLATLGARLLGRPLHARVALGLGVRRALPLLGARLAAGLALTLAGLPLGFVALAASFLWRYDASGGPTWIGIMALGLALVLPFLGLLFVVLAARLLFTSHAVVFEDLGPVAGLERAWALSRGQLPRIVFYGLLASLSMAAIGLVASPAAAMVGLPIPDYTAASAILGQPESWQPASGAAATLLARALATLGLPALATVLLGLWLRAGSILLYFDLRRRNEGFGRGHALTPRFRRDFEAAPAAPSIDDRTPSDDAARLEDAPSAPIGELGDPPAMGRAPELLTEVDAVNRSGRGQALPERLTVEGEAFEADDAAAGMDRPAPTAAESKAPQAPSPASGSFPVPAAGPAQGAPVAAPDGGMGSGGKALGTPIDPESRHMRRLIEMLPEPEQAPDPEARPGFLKRLMRWLPAPDAGPKADSETDANPDAIDDADRV